MLPYRSSFAVTRGRYGRRGTEGLRMIERQKRVKPGVVLTVPGLCENGGTQEIGSFLIFFI